MNDKFDELTKSLAQSVTRKQALKKFGVGLAGAVLASLGLRSKANAADAAVHCKSHYDCPNLGGTTLCCHGKCVNVDFDLHNCGSCGNHCPGGKYAICSYGFCTHDYPI